METGGAFLKRTIQSYVSAIEANISSLRNTKKTSSLEELARRLASRDPVDQLGDTACEAMDPTERFIQVEKLADRYNDEFDANGLLRLHLLSTMEKENV